MSVSCKELIDVEESGPFLYKQAGISVLQAYKQLQDDRAIRSFKDFYKLAWILMMNNKNNKSIFSNARKILEMALGRRRTVKEIARVSS